MINPKEEIHQGHALHRQVHWYLWIIYQGHTAWCERKSQSQEKPRTALSENWPTLISMPMSRNISAIPICKCTQSRWENNSHPGSRTMSNKMRLWDCLNQIQNQQLTPRPRGKIMKLMRRWGRQWRNGTYSRLVWVVLKNKTLLWVKACIILHSSNMHTIMSARGGILVGGLANILLLFF